MKLRGTALAAIFVMSAALGLAGCASPSPSGTATITSGPAPATVIPTSSPKPTPTPTPTGEDTRIGGAAITEAEFLTTVKAGWRGGGIPQDALLLQYGAAACDQLRRGTPRDSVQVLARAEVDQANNELLVKWGARRFCPEFS